MDLKAFLAPFPRPLSPASALKQVWNRNPCSAVVGAFNIQGSAWSRARRRFHTHDAAPPALETAVGPADVPGLAASGAGGGGYAAWSDGAKASQHLGAWAAAEGRPVP